MTSESGYEFAKHNRPFFVTHRPRFFGAELLDRFLYALIHFLDGIYGLLTFWSDRGRDWDFYLSNWIQDKLHIERPLEEQIILMEKYLNGIER